MNISEVEKLSIQRKKMIADNGIIDLWHHCAGCSDSGSLDLEIIHPVYKRIEAPMQP